MKSFLFLFSVLMMPPIFASAAETPDDELAEERRDMIAAIENDVRDTARLINRESFSERVMDAMASVPRHEFVPESQTISQPYIVALMTDLLEPRPGDRVLEIGTGSGYQAAILSRLVSDVYSIEIISELGEQATARLQRLGYDNVSTRIADGYDGWPEAAPFDGILVTAAISHIPPPLVRQLKPGGRMIIPVGTRFQTQYLTIVEKEPDGSVTTRQVIPVIFVPFTGGHQ
ncbi:MAG: protein-L-isoaspartate(D-aspartate) O-methyltransferase [Gammaproteobacteria bacterium]